MNPPEDSRRRLSLETLELIDNVSTCFDRALRNGEILSIKALLHGFDGSARQQLLLDLLLVDLEYRSPSSLDQVATEYLKRFPHDRHVVRKAIEKHREQHFPADEPASLITFAPAESAVHDTTLTLAHGLASVPQRMRNLDEYKLLRELGRGGMGIVYHARHRSTGQEVAVKMLLTGEHATDDQIKRFLREAQTANRLQHPNIVSVHKTGYCNGAPYFVMDYVNGQDLEALVRNTPVTQMEAALLIKTAARAIQYAHTQDVMHRDIKPSNLLLDQDTRLRITDFGLAKAISQGDTLTVSGNVVGTPAYMSPEQALADRDQIGPRSDVYSLGAVLFFLLTGRPPFQGDTVVHVMHQVVTSRPPHPRSLNHSITKGLAAICLKCLEKKPEDRYQSAAGLAEDLNRWQRMKPLLAQQPALQSLERRIAPEKQRFSPQWLTFITAVICLLIAGFLIIPRSGRDETSPTVFDTNIMQQFTQSVYEVAALVRSIGVPPQQQPPQTPQPGPPRPIIATGFNYEEGVAYSAQPFGVGRMTFSIDRRLRPGWKWYCDQPARVTDSTGHVLYPACEFTESERGGGQDSFTVWFLINNPRPSEKLEVDISAGDTQIAQHLELTLSEPGPVNQVAIRDGWWQAMIGNRWLNEAAQVQLIPSDELQVVNNYFLNMLMRRWNEVLPEDQHFELPAAPEEEASSGLEQQFEWMVGMLLGFESIRLAMMDLDPLQGNETADKVIHEIQELFTSAPPSGEHEGDRNSLAWYVPRECFSLRCLSVKNYLWVRDVVQGWGGSLDEIVAVPAVDDRIRDRIERQLAFYPNLATEQGIDRLLKDCALIGLDPYFHDGAAVGILFQAKEGANQELSELLKNQRKITRQDYGAELNENTKIGGQNASLLSTQQHRIRSFYVQSGEFHLITNSQTLASLFVGTADEPTKSLAYLDEYQAALNNLQNPSGYAAVLYVPSPFIENITSPEYVIEVARRRRAAHELRLLGLAVQAAKAEGFPFGQLVDLRGTFLERDFGRRQDSLDRPVLEGNSVCYDLERGYPGTFLPIADNPITFVTEEEAQHYADFKADYKAQWDTPQPVLLTFASDRAVDGTNQVVIEIRLTPFAQQKYHQLAQFLPSAPQLTQFDPLVDELLSLSLATQFGPLPAYFHLGLVDEHVPSQIANGTIERLGEFKQSQFAEKNYYFYVSPFSLIQSLAAQFNLENLAARYGLEDLLRNIRQVDDGVVGSRDDKILNQVENHIKHQNHLQAADRPSHFLMQLKDVKKSKVIDYMRDYTFITGRRTSAANAAVLNRLSADLRLPAQEAKSRLEEILGGQELEPEEKAWGSHMTQLQCPAGGVYVLDNPDNPRYWKSTGWQTPSLYQETEAPDNYEYPFLNWVKEFALASSLESDTQTLKSYLELTLREPPELPRPGRLEDRPKGRRGGGRRPPSDGPVLMIANQTNKVIQYRYGYIKGSLSEWSELLGTEDPVPLPLDQPIVLQYRTTGHTRRLLVGSEADLVYTELGWGYR